MEQRAAEGCSASHLVVFCHGLTSRVSTSELCHGQALVEALARRGAPGGAELHFSAANAGRYGMGTLVWTMSCGVEEGGKTLAEEVLALVRQRPSLRRLSFVGASLGGLFARCAAGLLLTDLPPSVTLHSLVTLATPHLGVRGLFSSRQLMAGQVFGLRTSADLDFRSDALSSMCELGSPCMDALAAFAVRVAFAPIPNDGIVAWSTAALTGRSPPEVVEESYFAERRSFAFDPPDIIVAEHSIGAQAEVEEWIGAEEEAYFVSERPEQSQRQRMWESLRNLHTVPWQIVEVNLPHKELATIYPRHRGESALNPLTLRVAEDVLRRVLDS